MYVKCFVKEQLLQVDLNSMKGTHRYCTNYTKCGIHNPDIILDATIDVFSMLIMSLFQVKELEPILV